MKFIRNLILLFVVLFIIFIALAVSGEGDKFRWLGKQIGGIASVAGDSLAKEADEIRMIALKYKKRIEGLTAPSSEKESVKSK